MVLPTNIDGKKLHQVDSWKRDVWSCYLLHERTETADHTSR